MEEKETQCQTFRELLLEKESDISSLSQQLEQANIECQPEVDAKTKLSNVLQALGQNISEEDSFDKLLEKVINIADGSKASDQFVGAEADDEKKKLVKVTQKLKSECLSLREKLAEMERNVSTNDQYSEECSRMSEELKSQSLNLEEVKVSLARVTAERERLQLKDKENETLREQQDLENNQLENALKQKIQEIDNLKEKNELLQGESESKSTEIVLLSEQNTAHQERLSVMESETHKLQEQHRNVSEKFDLKLSEYSQLSADSEKLSSSLEESRRETSRLREELISLSQGEPASSHLEQELDTCKEKISQMLQDKEICQEREVQVRSELAETEKKFIALESKYRERQEELNTANDKARLQESELSSLTSHLEGKEEELLKCQEKLEEYTAQTYSRDETFQGEIQLLKNQIEKLESSLANTEKDLVQSTSSGDSLDSELKQTKTLLEASDGQNRTLQAELHTLRESSDYLTTKLEASESSNHELTAKYETIASDYEKLQRELTQFEVKFQDFQVNASQVSETELQISELKAENCKLLEDLKSVKSGYESEITEMQLALGTATAQLNMFSEVQESYDNMKSNTTLLEEEMLQLKESYHQLQMEMTNLKSEKEDLAMRNIKYEEQETNFAKQKELYDSQLGSTNARIQELLQENENLQNSMKTHSESYLAVQKELESRELSLQKTRENLEEISNKEQNYIEALNSLKSINETISRTARDNEKEKVSLRENESQLVAQIELMKEQSGSIVSKNVELSSQVEILTAIKKGLEQEAVESNKRISSLEEDVRNLSTNKESNVVEEKDVDESEQNCVDKNMIQVLNEKIRENAKLKSENSGLMKNINQLNEEKDKLESEIEESKQTFSSMNSEALKKLSLMIRDKDLEIESLSQRNKSLLEILENEKGPKNEKDSERENLLLEEIKKLKEENVKDKTAVDNSNELLFLKGRILELESRLSGSPPAGLNTADLNGEREGEHIEDLNGDNDGLQSDRSLALRLETKSVQLVSSEKQTELLSLEIAELKASLAAKEQELCHMSEERNICKKRGEELEQEVERTRRSLLSVQGLLDEKKSSNESQQEQSLKYISECERLSKELTQVTNEKSAALQDNKARSQEAQDLRREVSAIIEKKKRVEGEVERLRNHLVQVEEGYTLELMEGEEREKELRKKVAGLEDSLRVATHTSSEVSESASQASHQLTAALEAAAGKRDKLAEELGSTQAVLRTRNMELRNLQLALEGFQKQKENEVGMLEKTCEEKVAREQRQVEEVQEKLRLNKTQLDRAQQGLEAAARLAEQLDKKSSTISNLKQEMSVREEMVRSLQEKMLDMTNGQVGKVDRDLVKNLVIGYAISDVSKKPEILRIIATVLDFNGDERAKTGLDGSSSSWLGGFLGANRSRHGSAANVPLEQNIARAFIKFLEEESSPKNPITLPVVEMARTKSEQLAQSSSRSGSTPSPLLAVETPPRMSLPSLASSHSPSILKSVLDQDVDSSNK